MRPVERGDIPTDAKGQSKQYNQYNQAQPDLISRIGEYCSYCERPIKTNLAVEHIQSKNSQPQLELSWNNFLLACTNCNSTKSTKVRDDITQSYYYWPSLDNTFRVFVYKPSGMIEINSALKAFAYAKAQKTLKLTGLDRHPNTLNKPSPKDKRWLHRQEAWDLAYLAKTQLAQNNNPKMRNFIVMNAKIQGLWSIWMTVFHDDFDMLNRLIQAFPGTCCLCFDSNGQPVHGLRGEL
ncbi:HNH endonuclease [Candidatus Marithrix sp. Canyon 246]|uniref:HNH endonuclease n=1 Tax=Candidatus Marithrix sp. Canyon 246 TaxID=1827136 RepID=UPI00084A14D5|nr:HNH endonuclease [Candidatus Marithrix sp. Canyon 246]